MNTCIRCGKEIPEINQKSEQEVLDEKNRQDFIDRASIAVMQAIISRVDIPFTSDQEKANKVESLAEAAFEIATAMAEERDRRR